MRTNNKTAKYLLEKGAIQANIFWYEKTINEIEKQQAKRKETLEKLKFDLYQLEKEYYDG